jgi:hypothetical protein
VLVSVAPGRTEAVLAAAGEAGIPAAHIGRTGGTSIRIHVDGRAVVDCPVAEAETRWNLGLAGRFGGRAA